MYDFDSTSWLVGHGMSVDLRVVSHKVECAARHY